MLNTTVKNLRCPKRKRTGAACAGTLRLPREAKSAEKVYELRSGLLKCSKCEARYPILAGVAIVVERVDEYIVGHAKGISSQIGDAEIPREYLSDYLEAKSLIQTEHIEEDLEAERVNALYLMNHYLHVAHPDGKKLSNWWKSDDGGGSPLIDQLVREYWDRGPFAQIRSWVLEGGDRKKKPVDAVELGCGVGGLYRVLKPALRSYLGVDSSFVSVALGRHLALGVPYQGRLKVPADLLQGTVSRNVQIPAARSFDGTADLIVGDLESLPLANASWDLALALNTIDMLDRPETLPAIQRDLLRKNGLAIQSCPYVWHENVARNLRKQLPKGVKDSARAVEWLYQQAGLRVREKVEHLPWLFFKHLRQLEIYSVHLFLSEKAS